VVRVEDGNLQELVNELLNTIKRWMVPPGMVIMLGSLAHLAKAGTAWYAAEWKHCRSVLKKELGGVIVIPLLPLVTEDVVGKHITRSLIEFLAWVDDLEDAEMELLKGVRRQYVKEFLAEDSKGDRWGDVLIPLRMPLGLGGDSTGTTLYRSRDWGCRPTRLRGLDEHKELVWLAKLSIGVTREMGISLAATVSSGRTLAAIRILEEGGKKLCFEVAGASNVERSAGSLVRKGMSAEKIGQKGWSLAVEKDVQDAITIL
jgi:hypothetical protein